MEEAARRYVHRILGIHGSLMALVLLIIVLMLGAIYHTTREQVLLQAQSRQELLAQQLASGVSSYYAGITDNLQLLNRMGPEEEPFPTTQEANATAPMPGLPPRPRQLAPAFPRSAIDRLQQSPRTGIALPFMRLLWNQLQERVTMLLVVERYHPLQKLDVYPEESEAQGIALVQSQQDLITATQSVQISTLQTEPHPSNLICVPLPRDRVLVAVVPVEPISRLFLDSINDQKTVTASMIDGSGHIMAVSDSRLIGSSIVADAPDPRIAEMSRKYLENPQINTHVFDHSVQMGDVVFPPRLVTLRPLTIAGHTFTVLLASDLSEVESVVNTMFRKALWWSIFVTISVTGILISTSTQLIRSRVRLEQERAALIQKELQQARDIQLTWLPTSAPSNSPVNTAAVNRPASHISGDFYDWFELPGGKTVVTIGDVTGHGLSATFLMAVTQLLIRNTMPRVDSPGKCLEEVNRQLCMQAFSGQFVTILVLVIDPANRKMHAATAGHFPPLVNTGKGYAPLTMEAQLVLAVEKTTEYPTERFDLQDKMELLLYTDGVIDTQSATGHRLTLKRICSALNASSPESAPKMVIDRLIATVDQFRGSRELDDDLTAVCVRLDLSKPLDHPPADAMVSI